MSATSVATTVRLDEAMMEQVAAVARADGVTTSHVIRTAIADYLRARVAADAFRARLARRVELDRVILERLSS